MTIILRPVGRGNWKTVTLRVEGARAAPMLVRVNDRLQLGGATFRVTEIRA